MSDVDIISNIGVIPKSIKKVWKMGGDTSALNDQTLNTDNIPEFLGSNTRGLIKITPMDGKLEEKTFWAENVQVIKDLPLRTADTINSGSMGYDSSGYPMESESAVDTGTEPRLTIKFDIQITPNGLTRQEFREKRAGYLFGYEREQVVVTSDMFRKALPMQFTNIGYTIPSGEESADYQVELTQITPTEDLTEEDEEALRTGINANGHVIQKEGELPSEWLARKEKASHDQGNAKVMFE